MNNNLLKSILSQNINQNNQLANHMYNIINSNNRSNKSICPYCNSSFIVKNGKNKNKQRYLCSNCKKSFIDQTNTPIYYSKKQISLWNKFLNCLIKQYSVRKTAHYLNISNTTAFIWRHKILNYLQKSQKNIILSGNIQCKEAFFKESFKGNHTKSKFKLNRKSHSGYYCPSDLISCKRIPVIAAIDSSNKLLLNPIYREKKTYINMLNFFSKNKLPVLKKTKSIKCFLSIDELSKNYVLSNYNKNFIDIMLRRNNHKITELDLIIFFKNKIQKNSKILFNYITNIHSFNKFISIFSLHILDNENFIIKKQDLNKPDTIIKALKYFLKPYKGVATKYLNNYFSLFKLIYNNCLCIN